MSYTLQIKEGTEEVDHVLTYMKLMEKATGIDNHALKQLAENREEWRRFVVGRIDTQTPD